MPLSPVLVRQLHPAVNRLETALSHGSNGMSGADDSYDELCLPGDVAERLVQRTEMRVGQVLSQSHYVQTNCRLYDLPRFEREELDVGDMIAYGGFSHVYDINAFRNENELTIGENKNRTYIIKHLNPKLALEPKKLVVGAKDLVMEAHFLSALKHEHVIELRGWSAAGVAGFAETGRADGFFLVFDKLQETLSRKIASWRERSKESKGSMLKANRASVRMQLFSERLQSAIDIASALEYLHENRIIYRDLKPGNVGYDTTGVLKIFDFGLAVELPAGSNLDSTFNLAGNTGTARYMAVEVIRKHPYNVKCDVFSYAVVLWELMALCKPYDGLAGPQVKECVAVLGERPTIPRSWPTILRRVLKRGWAESLADRPHMKEIKEALIKLHDASTKQRSLFNQ